MSGTPRDFAYDRLWRIHEVVTARDGQRDPFTRLKAICHACVDLLPVSGAGVMLMAERAHQGTLYATDDRIMHLEVVQNTAAEGPCIDAYNLGRPVLEPDLETSGKRTWPVLAAAALKVGIRSLFSFPLQLDDTCLGALDLFREMRGALTPDQIADARLLAALATREVLTLQAQAKEGTLPEQVADLSGDRAAIEQATGMVAAQLEASIDVAARRLRETAAELERSLAEVAHDVVARRLRLS